jgi:very-short-patch-repair endonuclease
LPTPRDKRNAAVVDLADRQHGAVKASQLVAAGVSRTTIGRWLRDGRLHRKYQGVYSLAPRLSDEGRLWAAVLATGATLDAQTAAWAWRVLPPHPDPLHLADQTRHRRRPGLTIRTSSLSDVVVLRGLPSTGLRTTLATLPEGLRDRARSNAAYQGLLSWYQPTNELERRFLHIVEAAALPSPQCQPFVLGRRRDFAWPEQRLIVELDGTQAHANAHAFEADRRRDAEASARGWRTVRFTAKQVFEEPAYVVAILQSMLTTLGTLA